MSPFIPLLLPGEGLQEKLIFKLYTYHGVYNGYVITRGTYARMGPQSEIRCKDQVHTYFHVIFSMEAIHLPCK